MVSVDILFKGYFSWLKKFGNYEPMAGLLNKSSRLAPVVVVTKLLIVADEFSQTSLGYLSRISMLYKPILDISTWKS